MSLEFKAQCFLAAARIPSLCETGSSSATWSPRTATSCRVLKLLQWKCPPNRWQLKSPTHTPVPGCIREGVPRGAVRHDAPRRVEGAAVGVRPLLHAVADGQHDIDPVTRSASSTWSQWGAAIDRVLAFRASGRDDKFFDIGFTTFQADPIAEIRALYDWLGRELTPATEERMQAWRADNPRDKHGSHQYDGAEFGLTDARLAERFGAYRERFRAYLD